MITVQELRTWASRLDPSGHVGIAVGGLTLVEVCEGDPPSGTYLEVGGCDEEPHPAVQPAASTVQDSAAVSAEPGAVVVSVADLLAMVGGSLTRPELARVRQAIRRSSIRDALGDVVFAVITARQRELTTQLRPLTDPDAFAGHLGRELLSSVPGERIGQLFAEIEEATGLSLIRVCFGEAARLCVRDAATGRLFDLGDIFESWLHGDLPIPGPTALWIGEPVDDFTGDELTPTGPHDYRLPGPVSSRD